MRRAREWRLPRAPAPWVVPSARRVATYACSDDHALALRQGARASPPRRGDVDGAREGSAGRAAAAAAAVLATFLPAGYPAAVAPAYAAYARWSAAAASFSAAGGVLSTHALLTAVGIGSAGAVPLAAALNWVIKDGLGQLGGVVSAALISTRFDAEPKRWRLLSAVALDASTLLEICTPLAPAFFLPLAALANVGKNVAWLSASASRAGLHQALAARGNLADVTAKAGSQTIAASTAGTLAGAAAAPLLGIGEPGPAVLLAFAALSAAHVGCVYAAVTAVALPTLNASRLRAALATAVATALRGGDDGDSVAAAVLGPAAVSRREGVLWAGDAGRIAAETPLHDLAARGLLRAAAVAELRAARYALVLDVPEPAVSGAFTVHVLLHVDAGWRDVLTAHVHALLLEEAAAAAAGADAGAGVESAETSADPRWEPRADGAPGGDSAHAVRARADAALAAHGDAIVTALEAAGWWVGMPLLERRQLDMRVHMDQHAADAG